MAYHQEEVFVGGQQHASKYEHISDYQWGSLAQQICRDLKELLNVAPDLETAAEYGKVLDEYFDVMSRDDPQHWIPNEKSASSGLARGEKRTQK